MPDIKASNFKQAAHELIDGLPDDATWEDLMYRIYVRQAIEAGLRDVEAGRVIEVDEIRRRLGLTDDDDVET